MYWNIWNTGRRDMMTEVEKTEIAMKDVKFD